MSLAKQAHARLNAADAGKVLHYAQAVDTPTRSLPDAELHAMRQNPKVNDTKKLGGLLPLYVGMVMILTQSDLPPPIVRGTAVLVHDIKLRPRENLDEHLR